MMGRDLWWPRWHKISDGNSKDPRTVRVLHLTFTDVDSCVSSSFFSKINNQLPGFADVYAIKLAKPSAFAFLACQIRVAVFSQNEQEAWHRARWPGWVALIYTHLFLDEDRLGLVLAWLNPSKSSSWLGIRLRFVGRNTERGSSTWLHPFTPAISHSG